MGEAFQAKRYSYVPMADPTVAVLIINTNVNGEEADSASGLFFMPTPIR